MCQHLKRCRQLGRCRHVSVSTRADIPDTNHMDFFICKLGLVGLCQHLKSADTWESADTSRCRHVPTSLILMIWNFLFGCWYVLTCVSTWKGADTWEGADTSRCQHVPSRADIPDTNHMDFFYLDADMCWHVSAPEMVPTPGKVPTRADTSRCRHVPTSLILCIWTFYLDADICWHVSAPEKVPTHGRVLTRADTSRCRHVPTRVDIPDANHMNFFICKLGCAGMCQHLIRCRHLGRCWHV